MLGSAVVSYGAVHLHMTTPEITHSYTRTATLADHLFKSSIGVLLEVGIADPTEFPNSQEHKDEEGGNDQKRKKVNIAVIHITVAFSG